MLQMTQMLMDRILNLRRILFWRNSQMRTNLSVLSVEMFPPIHISHVPLKAYHHFQRPKPSDACLYFALCTMVLLFTWAFLFILRFAYLLAVRLHIPILVRRIGSSSGLLEIISNPPLGSEELRLQVLQTLTDRIVPSPELLATIRKLYDTKLKVRNWYQGQFAVRPIGLPTMTIRR